MEFFVYGTLTDPATADSLLKSFEYRGTATLRGLRRVDGEYPTLVPGGETTGRLLVTDDVETLDRYEGVDGGLYVRIEVPRTDSGCCDSVRPGAKLSLFRRLKRARSDSTAVHTHNNHYETGENGSNSGVATYVGHPEKLGVEAEWPGDGPFSERVRRYVADNDVVIER